MILDINIKCEFISYMKRITSPGSMHDTGCLGLVRWDDPKGWYGEGGIQPVHSKGDQSWVFFGRNDAKAETPVLWLPHAKS